MYKFNAITVVLMGLFSAGAAVADDDKGELTSIEVITVTGEKFERSLKDTTSSVSVVDSEELESGIHQSVNGAIDDIPNVVTLTGAVPDIRGVSGNGAATGFHSFAGGANTRVATITDGVAEPFVADLTGNTGLWDIEQIEVFRGPQSTSNGRNSIGGALVINTKDPSFDWEGAAMAGYRTEDNFVDTAFALTGPLIDDVLAFRLSGQYLDGETFNKGITHAGREPRFDQNDLTTQRLRGKLLWQPTGDSDLKFQLNFSHNNEEGDSGRNYYVGKDHDAFDSLFDRFMDTKSNTSSFEAHYKPSSSYAFDFLAAYVDYDWKMLSFEKEAKKDADVTMLEEDLTLDAKFSFGLDSDTFNGFIALAYFERDQDFNSVGGSVYDGVDSSKSYATYGEMTYAITDKIKLTAGGRIQKEEQVRDFNMLFGGSTLSERLDNDDTIALPKLVLQYMITDTTTLGLSARQGYNSGGGTISFNAQEYYTYDAEYVNAYEFSVRSGLMDGDLNLAANLFYNDYKDYQGSDATRTITNIEQATTYGLEVEVDAMLSNDLQMMAGLGLLSSEIDKADVSFGDIVGNELNSAPNVTANLGFKYWLTNEFTVGINGNYVGEYYGDINNSDSRKAGDYTVAGLTLDYQYAAWRVSVYANNLFDERGLTVNEPPGRSYEHGYVAVIDPQNFGANVIYRF